MSIESNIYHIQQAYNSLDWVIEHIDNFDDGSVFLFKKLHHARGRRGRIWKIYPGQLLLTLLLKPAFSVQTSKQLPGLAMALSVGFLQPLRSYNIGFKWPNDFVTRGKKVGGLIIEVVWQQLNVKGIVVGLGLNVNTVFAQSDDLACSATSLRMIAENKVEQNLLLSMLLRSANMWYKKWQKGKYEEIFQMWRVHQVCRGKTLLVHHVDGRMRTGVMKDVRSNGDLVLDDGQVVPYFAVEEVLLI